MYLVDAYVSLMCTNLLRYRKKNPAGYMVVSLVSVLCYQVEVSASV
jgi:hypothetical protein